MGFIEVEKRGKMTAMFCGRSSIVCVPVYRMYKGEEVIVCRGRGGSAEFFVDNESMRIEIMHGVMARMMKTIVAMWPCINFTCFGS